MCVILWYIFVDFGMRYVVVDVDKSINVFYNSNVFFIIEDVLNY